MILHRPSPIVVRRNLTIAVGRQRVRLTPAEGLAVSEAIARASIRRMFEHAGDVDASPRGALTKPSHKKDR